MSRPAAAWLMPLLLARLLAASPAPAAEPVDVTTTEGPPKHDAIVELAKPFHESPVRRFETVFFISLPFTALYGSLITTAAGYAIQGKRFRLTTPVLAVDLSVSCALAAWIAGRDVQAWRNTPAVSLPFPPPASATPALPATAWVSTSPELSATTTVPSSTVLR